MPILHCFRDINTSLPQMPKDVKWL